MELDYGLKSCNGQMPSNCRHKNGSEPVLIASVCDSNRRVVQPSLSSPTVDHVDQWIRNPDASLYVGDSGNGVRVRRVLIGLVGFVDNDGLLPVMTADAPFGSSPWHNRFVHGHSGYRYRLASGNRRRGIIDLWLPSLAFDFANEISSTEQIDHEILALHTCIARCGARHRV